MYAGEPVKLGRHVDLSESTEMTLIVGNQFCRIFFETPELMMGSLSMHRFRLCVLTV